MAGNNFFWGDLSRDLVFDRSMDAIMTIVLIVEVMVFMGIFFMTSWKAFVKILMENKTFKRKCICITDTENSKYAFWGRLAQRFCGCLSKEQRRAQREKRASHTDEDGKGGLSHKVEFEVKRSDYRVDKHAQSPTLGTDEDFADLKREAAILA